MSAQRVPDIDHEAYDLIRAAIEAMNNLVVHLNHHPNSLRASTRAIIVECDWALNSATADVLDLVGEFPPPVVVP